MKDIFKIAFSLTIICVAAAVILGVVFAVTDHARKLTEEKNEHELVQGLLGYSHEKKAPEDLNIYQVYRYVITDKGKKTLGYVLPVKGKKFVLAQVDLEGNPVSVAPIEGDAVAMAEKASRDAAVAAVVKGPAAVFADKFFVADKGSERLGYVVPGATQGFKTVIDLMISLDPKFTVTGVEIQKSEEDPGLGDEIKKAFFRNQFVGKTLEQLKELQVIKEPMPGAYKTALDPEKAKKADMNGEQISKIKAEHVKDNIYALTGATISSRALTNGVKDTARKFVYRWDILKNAMEKQNVQAAF
jgi:Na+-translocating ferredoxin:NAD+ oxidoreductase subunit G